MLMRYLIALLAVLLLAACQPQPDEADSQDAADEPTPTGRIVFQSSRDDDWEIYVVNADGSDVRRLTDNDGIDDEARPHA
mgnify:FL=1